MGRLSSPAASLATLLAGFVLLGPQPACSDPCGMVPPAYIPLAEGEKTEPTIVRVGVQQTYVFYKNGIETIVIRPGFKGKIDEFGMLIPFPAPPEIRKVPEQIFAHIAAAVDPPEVELDLRPQGGFGGGFGGMGGAIGGIGGGLFGGGLGVKLKRDEVRVVREEAVGMYEVAVLEAGSPAALKRWMGDHGYRFPTGMEKVCNDYIRESWGFVAVKAKVGLKAGVNPKPGMRKVDAKLPAGSTFDGHVQAMGFRFRSRRLEVPMRLSAFNEGPLHNIVYLLADEPAAIRSIGVNTVVRQIPGILLKQNLTALLPVRLLGAKIRRGRITNLSRKQLKSLETKRDPAAKNGHARELFASDLLAVRHNRLSHPHEDTEKNLVQISERLGLRGTDVDEFYQQELVKSRKAATGNALQMLNRMTLTVIDGDFSREVIARKNLTFRRFKMRRWRNRPRYYDAKLGNPAKIKTGILLRTAALDRFVVPHNLPADVSPSRESGNVAVANGPAVSLPTSKPTAALATSRKWRIWSTVIITLATCLFAGVVAVRRREL